MKTIGYSEKQTGHDWNGFIYCIESQISDNGTQVPIFANYSDTPAGNYYLMQVFPLNGIDKRYGGAPRTYLNYKARGREYDYLPNGVPPALALAGLKEALGNAISEGLGGNRPEGALPLPSPDCAPH